MKSLKIPQETINLIFGQLNGLGDPDQLEQGYKYQNGIQGQIELPAEHGNRDLRSQLLSYTAEVVEKDGKLDWEIKTIQIPGDESVKLIF